MSEENEGSSTIKLRDTGDDNAMTVQKAYVTMTDEKPDNSKRVVWKYPLNAVEHQYLELPKGADILTVQTQGEGPQLWALVNPDPDIPKETRHIHIMATGEQKPSYYWSGLSYIATFQIMSLVFHVFEDVRMKNMTTTTTTQGGK